MALANLVSRGGNDPDVAKKRQELWEKLNNLVIADGSGWLTSAPGARRVRLEVREGSALPIRLAERGFKLNFVGSGSRLTASGDTPVQIIEFRIDGR